MLVLCLTLFMTMNLIRLNEWSTIACYIAYREKEFCKWPADYPIMLHSKLLRGLPFAETSDGIFETSSTDTFSKMAP